MPADAGRQHGTLVDVAFNLPIHVEGRTPIEKMPRVRHLVALGHNSRHTLGDLVTKKPIPACALAEEPVNQRNFFAGKGPHPAITFREAEHVIEREHVEVAVPYKGLHSFNALERREQ